jgi:hypothetical protein
MSAATTVRSSSSSSLASGTFMLMTARSSAVRPSASPTLQPASGANWLVAQQGTMAHNFGSKLVQLRHAAAWKTRGTAVTTPQLT